MMPVGFWGPAALRRKQRGMTPVGFWGPAAFRREQLGMTPVGFSGPAALRREERGMTLKIQNLGNRDISQGHPLLGNVKHQSLTATYAHDN
jgi:hypothetical protein